MCVCLEGFCRCKGRGGFLGQEPVGGVLAARISGVPLRRRLGEAGKLAGCADKKMLLGPGADERAVRPKNLALFCSSCWAWPALAAYS